MNYVTILNAARERAERHRKAENDLYNNLPKYSYERIYNSEIASFEEGVKWAKNNCLDEWISFNEQIPPVFSQCIIAMKNKNKEDDIWLYDICEYYGGNITDNNNWVDKINWETPLYWKLLKEPNEK